MCDTPKLATRLKLERLPTNLDEIKSREVLLESGSDIQVALILPDGREDKQTFKMGTLVSYIKFIVEQKYGYSMTKQILSLSDKDLLDPLCLSDIPSISESDVNFIKIRVE